MRPALHLAPWPGLPGRVVLTTRRLQRSPVAVALAPARIALRLLVPVRSRLSWIGVLSIPLLVASADADRIPDDPRFHEQWALVTVRAPAAWAWTTGSARTVVAILDTGIMPHPDLQERLLPGYDFVSDRSAAADGDGRDPDPTGEGAWKHGTPVAGIVGASTNNGVGIAGIDWACRILPVRVVGADGIGKTSDVADAIRWAAGLHVDGVPDNATPAD